MALGAFEFLALVVSCAAAEERERVAWYAAGLLGGVAMGVLSFLEFA